MKDMNTGNKASWSLTECEKGKNYIQNFQLQKLNEIKDVKLRLNYDYTVQSLTNVHMIHPSDVFYIVCCRPKVFIGNMTINSIKVFNSDDYNPQIQSLDQFSKVTGPLNTRRSCSFQGCVQTDCQGIKTKFLSLI